MKDYGYLDYGTIAPLLIPPFSRQRDTTTTFFRIVLPPSDKSLTTLMAKALKTGAKSLAWHSPKRA